MQKNMLHENKNTLSSQSNPWLFGINNSHSHPSQNKDHQSNSFRYPKIPTSPSWNEHGPVTDRLPPDTTSPGATTPPDRLQGVAHRVVVKTHRASPTLPPNLISPASARGGFGVSKRATESAESGGPFTTPETGGPGLC